MRAARRSLNAFAATALATAALAASAAPEDPPAPAPVPAKDAPAKDTSKDAAKGTAADPVKEAQRLDAALKNLARQLGDLKSLQTSFTHRKYLEVFKEEVVSRGTLSLAVQSRLRWEFTEPLRSVLIVNGDRARRERVSRKGARTSKSFPLADDPVAAATAEQVFLWTRGDFETARKTYDLVLVSETPLVVRATPRDERVSKIMASIELRFAADLRFLAEVTLVERANAKTVITFSDVRRDAELAKDLFLVEE